MGFNSAFKGLKLFLKTGERAFKQFKWPRPQCVKCKHVVQNVMYASKKYILCDSTHVWCL